jgi:hypothetical protein
MLYLHHGAIFATCKHVVRIDGYTFSKLSQELRVSFKAPKKTKATVTTKYSPKYKNRGWEILFYFGPNKHTRDKFDLLMNRGNKDKSYSGQGLWPAWWMLGGCMAAYW